MSGKHRSKQSSTTRQIEAGELVRLIYKGPLERKPWQAFADRLRAVLAASALSIVLSPNDKTHTEIHVLATEPDDDTNWEVLNKLYIRDYIDIDPTASDKVAPGEILSIDSFKDSLYYTEFLNPIGIEFAVRMGFSEPGGMQCWLAAAKAGENGPFSESDTELLRYLLPHLEQALALYANIMLSQSEKALYKDAIERLAFGSILLDGGYRIISANQIAIDIINNQNAINVTDGKLNMSDDSVNVDFQHALANATLHRDNAPTGSRADLLRIECDDDNFLGLLIRPVCTTYFYQGKHTPNVIIYISDLAQHIDNCDRQQSETQSLIAKLFCLTPTEAKLALLLADGKTLRDSAALMSISEKTARNHSKNIFEKTGIKRQVDLVRLIYKSVALLG